MCGVAVISPTKAFILLATVSSYDMVSLIRGALCLHVSLSPLSAFQGDPLLWQPSTCDAWPPALAAFLAPLREWQQPERGPRSHPRSGPQRNPWPSGSLPCPLTAQSASSWAAAQQPWRGKIELARLCRCVFFFLMRVHILAWNWELTKQVKEKMRKTIWHNITDIVSL